MMDISGQVVRFFLSAEGRRALKGVVPTRGSFEAFVIAIDEFGPVVWSDFRGRKKVPRRLRATLFRWDYIASMVFDYRFEPGAPPAAIGFRPA
jgi:hypothetical protein